MQIVISKRREMLLLAEFHSRVTHSGVQSGGGSTGGPQ